MRGIQRHYDRVAEELLVADEDGSLPSRVHAIVLVSKMHKPTLRAVAYARAARPNMLEAVTVDVDDDVDRATDAAVGRGRHPGAAAGAELAVPRDHPADHRVRARHPAAKPARCRHGLHPRVRRRPLVGADPAQPERAADQGPAAVHARRDGHVGAVPAAVVGGCRGAGRARVATSGRASGAATAAGSS